MHQDKTHGYIERLALYVLSFMVLSYTSTLWAYTGWEVGKVLCGTMGDYVSAYANHQVATQEQQYDVPEARLLAHGLRSVGALCGLIELAVDQNPNKVTLSADHVAQLGLSGWLLVREARAYVHDNNESVACQSVLGFEKTSLAMYRILPLLQVLASIADAWHYPAVQSLRIALRMVEASLEKQADMRIIHGLQVSALAWSGKAIADFFTWNLPESASLLPLVPPPPCPLVIKSGTKHATSTKSTHRAQHTTGKNTFAPPSTNDLQNALKGLKKTVSPANNPANPAQPDTENNVFVPPSTEQLQNAQKTVSPAKIDQATPPVNNPVRPKWQNRPLPPIPTKKGMAQKATPKGQPLQNNAVQQDPFDVAFARIQNYKQHHNQPPVASDGDDPWKDDDPLPQKPFIDAPKIFVCNQAKQVPVNTVVGQNTGHMPPPKASLQDQQKKLREELSDSGLSDQVVENVFFDAIKQVAGNCNEVVLLRAIENALEEFNEKYDYKDVFDPNNHRLRLEEFAESLAPPLDKAFARSVANYFDGPKKINADHPGKAALQALFGKTKN